MSSFGIDVVIVGSVVVVLVGAVVVVVVFWMVWRKIMGSRRNLCWMLNKLIVGMFVEGLDVLFGLCVLCWPVDYYICYC